MPPWCRLHTRTARPMRVSDLSRPTSFAFFRSAYTASTALPDLTAKWDFASAFQRVPSFPKLPSAIVDEVPRIRSARERRQPYSPAPRQTADQCRGKSHRRPEGLVIDRTNQRRARAKTSEEISYFVVINTAVSLIVRVLAARPSENMDARRSNCSGTPDATQRRESGGDA